MVTGKFRITDFQTSIFDSFMRIFSYSIYIYNNLIKYHYACIIKKLIIHFNCRNVFNRQKKKTEYSSRGSKYIMLSVSYNLS